MFRLYRIYRRVLAEIFALDSYRLWSRKVLIYFPSVLIGEKHINWGYNCRVLERSRIEVFDSFNGDTFKPKVTFGNNVSINYDFHLGCINSVEVGDNVLIASRVTIIDHNHGDTTLETLELSPSIRDLVSKGGIKICRNVWLGENCVVLGGVEIGENSVIGAGEVVRSNIPANSIFINDTIIKR
jgi:acetyltransferase-like isoleucine patch superfamily enzyme